MFAEASELYVNLTLHIRVYTLGLRYERLTSLCLAAKAKAAIVSVTV